MCKINSNNFNTEILKCEYELKIITYNKKEGYFSFQILDKKIKDTKLIIRDHKDKTYICFIKGIKNNKYEVKMINGYFYIETLNYLKPNLTKVGFYKIESINIDIRDIHNISENLNLQINKENSSLFNLYISDNSYFVLTELFNYELPENSGCIANLNEFVIYDDSKSMIITYMFENFTNYIYDSFKSDINLDTNKNNISEIKENISNVEKENKIIIKNNVRAGKLIGKDKPSIVWKFAKIVGSNKKCIIKLKIPEEADFINPITEQLNINKHIKQRCSRAVVLEIQEYRFDKIVKLMNVDAKSNSSLTKIIYKIGQIVIPDSFDQDIKVQCSNGIHVFSYRDGIKSYLEENSDLIEDANIVKVETNEDVNLYNLDKKNIENWNDTNSREKEEKEVDNKDDWEWKNNF